MKTSKRQFWTAEYANEVLERIDREGLRDTEMAKRVGGSAARIRWWRRRLRPESEAMESNQLTFIEVPLSRPSARATFVIHAQGGRKVEVESGVDGTELRRILAVVEGLPC